MAGFERKVKKTAIFMGGILEIQQIILDGALGRALRRSLENRLKKVNYSNLVEPFRLRNETDGAWRCEFWGKIIRSAILSNYHLQDAEMAKMISDSVKDMMSTQTPDGCISSYPTELQTGKWDIWGRKYVVLGLMRYYELCGRNAEVLDCAVKILDHLMTQVGPRNKSIVECGEHGGLAASSILGAVVTVYKFSRLQRMKDFAEYIIETGCSHQHNIFQAAMQGVKPCNIGNAKAYELTSCFEGLLKMYEFSAAPEALASCVNYLNAVKEHELFITGVAGLKDLNGEFWYDGKTRQTRNDCGALGETCVTTTLLRFYNLLRKHYHNTEIYDLAEVTLYNGILGATTPETDDWIHANPTPLTGGGYKQSAPDQMQFCFKAPFDNNDCCRAQGPEALALAPDFAVEIVQNAVQINFYEAMDVILSDHSTIKIRGNYPFEDKVKITFSGMGTPVKIRLRIPHFCQKLLLDQFPQDITKGEFHQCICTNDSTIELSFDLAVKEIPAFDHSGHTALMSGPIVLATDSRQEPSLYNRIYHYQGRILTDYASAGNAMNPKNTLTVWHSSL